MPSDKLMTRKQAARLLHVHEKTLVRWAREGKGPGYIRVGRKVLYPVSTLNAWLSERSVA